MAAFCRRRDRKIAGLMLSGLLITLGLLSTISSVDAVCPDPNGPCEDCVTWCDRYQDLCGTEPLVSNCRSTCGLCPTSQVCTQKGCSQECVEKDNGTTAVCSCGSGYELDADGVTCNDVNECILGVDCGDSICHNTKGSHLCTICLIANKQFSNYYNSTNCCIPNNSEQCGKSVPAGRIVENNLYSRNWPWTAHISNENFTCSGVLISHNWAASSAHCFQSMVKHLNQVTVRVGISDPSIQFVHGQIFSVEEYVRNPNWTGVAAVNDVVLLRLSKAAIYSDYVRAICLPGGETPVTGERCVVTGFDSNFTPLQASLPIVEASMCSVGRADQGYKVCGGFQNRTGDDTCQIAPGGPLVCQRCSSCDWYLAGVSSFGRSCGSSSNHEAYSGAEQMEKWINGVISAAGTNKFASCPRGAWTLWTRWSDCSGRCTNGTVAQSGSQTRQRECVGADVGSVGCVGVDRNLRPCNASCQDFSAWTSWGACSATCGNGVSNRTRSCPGPGLCGADHHGTETAQQKPCLLGDCPWGNWGAFEPCTATCGTGTETRRRTCDAGPGQCRGNDTDSRQCKRTSCDPCGGKVDGRTVSCQDYANIGFCTDEPGGDDDNCALTCCKKTMFSDWGAWGACDATCGVGKRSRSRSCPRPAGAPCLADRSGSRTRQEETCNLERCPLVFGAWTSWSRCSVTCGEGVSRRTRSCPGPGSCPADGHGVQTAQERPCNPRYCPWRSWGAFGPCSVTCGSGRKVRKRVCSGAEGSCYGDDTQAEPCYHDSSCLCVGVRDNIYTEYCPLYAKYGYCWLYKSFMTENCNRTCCLYENNLDFARSSTCVDVWDFHVCAFYAFADLCHVENLRINCQKACNQCA